ncbi:MAG: phospholipase [Alphaproteobacteria bacterium]|nr:phospholipase [Alphaproteobacteria bacterium]
MEFNIYTQKPHSGGTPKQAVLLLHGYGSNGRDLISLAPYWQSAIPDAVFVSPDAPFPCEIGMGYQWFSLGAYTAQALLEGSKMAHPLLDQLISQVLEQYGLDESELALVGFSQGTMMALYTGLRRSQPLAGILGYSGALAGAEELPEGPDIARPPIRLIHGEADSVVTIDRYHDAVQKLGDLGYKISGHTTPGLEHSIDGQGIESGSKFLKEIFN